MLNLLQINSNFVTPVLNPFIFFKSEFFKKNLLCYKCVFIYFFACKLVRLVSVFLLNFQFLGSVQQTE